MFNIWTGGMENYFIVRNVFAFQFFMTCASGVNGKELYIGSW